MVDCQAKKFSCDTVQRKKSLYDQRVFGTNANKLMGENIHGTSSEQRATLDQVNDYQIATGSTYKYLKGEIGKETEKHKCVRVWHYFINDIYFAEYKAIKLHRIGVSINVKETVDGHFFYSFAAEK